jgi:23S rRNA U2552 (ribose-2'-O)-methylase RlmE/FtsJ
VWQQLNCARCCLGCNACKFILTIIDFFLSQYWPKAGSRQLDADQSTDLCLRALELASIVLKPEGSVILKIFQGKPFQLFWKSVRI